ncbi:MAG: glucosyltransferase I RfaG [Legionellales bacterium]|nr:glucosyltransferase I RfaG [Legionellales bacterium]
MRLAFCLFKYFPYGGLQRDFKHIIEQCLARGHTVDIYALEWQGDSIPGTSLTVINVKALSNHRRYYLFAKQVLARLQAEQYAAVIGFNKMPGLDFYYAADPCYTVKMATLRHPLSRLSLRYRCLAALERAVFAADGHCHVLHLTDLQKQDFIDYYHTPATRFHLLPPGIARDRLPPVNHRDIGRGIRQELGIDADDKLLLMVGSGFKTKGLDRALRSVAALPAELRRQVRFVVIGQDKPDSFIQMAKSLGIKDNVTILPGRTDIPRFLFAADCLIHPAYSENTGTVILEAIVAGLPVLATDVCGYANHVTQSGCGQLITSPFDQTTMNQQLLDMLRTEEQGQWSARGVAYGESEDLYDMPNFVVSLVESAGQAKELANG